ncbi:MAG TPA: aldose epimerase family protein [Lacipirellula sp.]
MAEFFASTPSGIRAKWVSLGASLAELHVPDRDGNLADVVLGFDTNEQYHSQDNQHFGATTGRFANRIAGGNFRLDGKEYQLAQNNGPNHLHGGPNRGLGLIEWQGEAFEGELGSGVRFRYTSPDGEENYPGTLDVTVTYTLTPMGAVRIDYAATTDKPTIINLTNHSYFNLAGHGTPSVLDHVLWIAADRYTPKNAVDIPTGEIAEVAGTPFDFQQRRVIGERIDQLGDKQADGYDHNFVLNGPEGVLKLIAELYHRPSGRKMQVHTDQPGVQLYVGNMLKNQPGKGGKRYPRRSALCLETQHFPDSPNHPNFPSTVLGPGETYRHACTYEFSVERDER